MEDLYGLIADAVKRGQKAALATVVRVRGSTPRGVGTKMLVYADGRTVGTIGGGELEWLVVEQAREAMDEGAPRLVHYELRDAEGGSVGTCGGEAEVFVDVVVPSPTLLIVGGGHVAVPVAEIGHLCGLRVVVLDDRADMVREDRFPHAARRIAGDMAESLRALEVTPETCIVIVTRGHAYDEEALRAVIDSPAAYIGMIGSRRKVRTVFEHLRADGIGDDLIQRVRSPIGLDIGAQTPAEIAVSIVAEIIMLRYSRRGIPMKLET